MIDFYNAIKPELATLFIAIITGIVSYLGSKLKKIIDTKIKDETIRSIVKTGVTAMEQVYQNATSEEKLQLAKEKILEVLEERKIKVSELELLLLIEEQVHCCKKESGDK